MRADGCWEATDIVRPKRKTMNPTATGEQASTEPQATEQRDARGRFTKGNAGGPGNPFARQVALLRATMVHCGTPEDMAPGVRTPTEKPAAGELAAMKLCFQYVL